MREEDREIGVGITGGVRLPEPREILVPVQVRCMWPARRGATWGYEW